MYYLIFIFEFFGLFVLLFILEERQILGYIDQTQLINSITQVD